MLSQALVSDPGGEQPKCVDIGTASVDLKADVLDAGADIVDKVLPIIDPAGKKVAEIIVTVKALQGLSAVA